MTSSFMELTKKNMTGNRESYPASFPRPQNFHPLNRKGSTTLNGNGNSSREMPHLVGISEPLRPLPSNYNTWLMTDPIRECLRRLKQHSCFNRGVEDKCEEPWEQET